MLKRCIFYKSDTELCIGYIIYTKPSKMYADVTLDIDIRQILLDMF